MSHYIVYWKPETVADNWDAQKLRHSASEQYKRISIGDVLWIVSSRGFGDLLLINRQDVDRKTSHEELSRKEAAELWSASYHVFTDSPAEVICVDITDVAPQLRFDGTSDRLPTEFSGRNFQTMRKLTARTVELLEDVWQARKHLGKNEDPAPFLA